MWYLTGFFATSHSPPGYRSKATRGRAALVRTNKRASRITSKGLYYPFRCMLASVVTPALPHALIASLSFRECPCSDSRGLRELQGSAPVEYPPVGPGRSNKPSQQLGEYRAARQYLGVAYRLTHNVRD